MAKDMTLVKEEMGVSIYKKGNNYIMYVKDIKVLEIAECFKDMLDKSYDNLVRIQKQNSNT